MKKAQAKQVVYACATCGETFTHAGTRNLHVAKKHHTAQAKDQPRRRQALRTRPLRRFACPAVACPAAFLTRNGRNIHIGQCHPHLRKLVRPDATRSAVAKKRATPATPAVPRFCPTCGIRLDNPWGGVLAFCYGCGLALRPAS